MRRVQVVAIIIVIVVAAFTATAQTTQSGYVKTKGRMDSKGQLIPGTRLGGAAITLTGGRSTVSGTDGNFTLTIPDKKFYLQNVQKQGYQIVDPEVLKKQYVCSANPLVITMETPDKQLEDQVEAQKKIENTLRQQLRLREKELEALKEAHKLTEEEYYKKMQQLYDEKVTENLVKEMSKRYAEIDYDLIDSFQRQFSQYILNGELRKADSLLKTKGDLTSDIQELHQVKEANAMDREALERRRVRLDSSMSYAQWLMEDIAMRCYNKAEIFKMQYQNDSAAYYLELRANLDTTNVEWLTDFGNFEQEYMADYRAALSCYRKSLLIAKRYDTEDIAACYINIGSVYLSVGIYDTAMEYFHQSLSIDFSAEEIDYLNVASACHNIGVIYYDMGNYDSALIYQRRALRSYDSAIVENFKSLVDYYSGMGSIFNAKGETDSALYYHNMSLSLIRNMYGDYNPQNSMVYSNIGNVYEQLGKYDTALKYYFKSLEIDKGFFGEKHPLTALGYSRIARIHYQQGDYNTAVDYYQKTLELLFLFFEKHHNIAVQYNDLGITYSAMNKDSLALDSYKQALKINLLMCGEKHPAVAANYNNIGLQYYYWCVKI